MLFELTVHYFTTICGEQEKDFDYHDVEAPTLEEAVKKVKTEYGPERNKIINHIYYENEKVERTLYM